MQTYMSAIAAQLIGVQGSANKEKVEAVQEREEASLELKELKGKVCKLEEVVEDMKKAQNRLRFQLTMLVAFEDD